MKEGVQYVRADEFFSSAEDTNLPEQVKAELREEQGDINIDLFELRRQAAWGVFANKIVGAECSPWE